VLAFLERRLTRAETGLRVLFFPVAAGPISVAHALARFGSLKRPPTAPHRRKRF